MAQRSCGGREASMRMIVSSLDSQSQLKFNLPTRIHLEKPPVWTRGVEVAVKQSEACWLKAGVADSHSDQPEPAGNDSIFTA
ncbi:hypothetical protein PCANC_25316 [Puccinia coronata f. sp. avenae]|uniref:Uncharacterized protein n=1 Tax=Puccinia coronata f. sp. avenae TaxID=200324 RepID=A0A2N5TKI2_9BASI|nr:hypothetical protein PCASD_23717 [Puccinia coronata f. sp. avenae]PLW26001.1 hypothetical protein PCANC_25316 [Puccinia coronata f. sp. avenae]PLW33469.1 hypothetical protein PCASD_14419 [Puccinia coronata f. sp. avenae]